MTHGTGLLNFAAKVGMNEDRVPANIITTEMMHNDSYDKNFLVKKPNRKEKGDFNVNDFIYGVSAYLGFSETSLYVKYDLNPMFADNAVKQNNVSLGVRFDFN
jgi:hypothetical protein